MTQSCFTPLLRTFLSAAALCCVALAANGASPNARPLFEPDLSNALNTGGVWGFEGDTLTASEDQNIWTPTEHENFVLELEFRNDAGTNSGVILYCSDTNNWIPNAVEIQIADDFSDQWKNADPSWQCGAFFGHKPAIQRGIVRPPGEWNHMRVMASGSFIVVEMNGQLVNSIDLSQFTSAEVAPDGTAIPAWLNRPWAELETRGRIGFQGKHAGADIAFRNIQIRDLNELEQAGLRAVNEPLAYAVHSGLQLGSGVNISHWLSQRGPNAPDPREYFTDADVTLIAEQGFDHIRLPIEESVMWKADGSRDDEAFATLDRALQWIHAAGLTAIVDLHIVNSHHFNATNDGGSNTLFTDPASQDHLIALWVDLSAHLKKWDNDFLAYEILNEAVADQADDWNQLLAKSIAALRELEPARPIIVGSNRWQSAATFPELRLPSDDPNLILSFHFYNPFFFTHYKASWVGDYSAYDGPVHYPGLLVTNEELNAMPDGPLKESIKANQGPNDKETLRAAMRPAIEYARARRLPLYCGEWGALKTVDRSDMLQWYRDMSAILAEEGIQHAIWDYQGGFSIKNFRTGAVDQELIDAILGR